MTTREQFNAIRRAYRLARKVSPLAHDQAVTLYMATVSSMRAFTNRWDCCEPGFQMHDQAKKRGRHWSRPLHVAAACTRWIKTHQGA